jgi:hypothetical protein
VRALVSRHKRDIVVCDKLCRGGAEMMMLASDLPAVMLWCG